MRGRWFIGFLCALAGVIAPTSAQALDIVEVRWGFDGKLGRNRFNLLSILVSQPVPTAFDGELRLTKRMHANRVDAPLIESVFVSPFGERWVQFTPYISGLGNQSEGFQLDVISKSGQVLQSVELPQARFGWPARVIIESGGLSRKNLPLKRLPEVLFPSSVTATDGLQAVFFDSVPNWDEPRRQAFLDWLTLGGTVFVMPEAGGSFPAFPAALGALNSPLDLHQVGAGRVFRVPYSRAEATAEKLTETMSVLPVRRNVRNDGTVVEAPAIDNSEQDQSIGDQFQDASDPLSGASFLSRLKGMTKPDHNWPLLHLLFWVYIALIFPGCYLVGRRWTDYRAVYIALVGTVVLFSVLFGYVGQRGYGEATAVHSIAIARTLPDGQADITQWSNVFVTSGGDYDISHVGTGAMYSTASIAEPVSKWIRNGSNALFRADIPPFSSREFTHRVKARVPVPKFKIANAQFNGPSLQSLQLSWEGELPATAEMLTLLHGERFYNMQRLDGSLQTVGSMGTAAGFLRVQDFQNNWQHRMGYYGSESRPVVEQYREMFHPLMARRLGVVTEGDAQTFRLPPGLVRLMYLAPMTDAYFVNNPHVGRQEGWVLYSIDLPLEGP